MKILCFVEHVYSRDIRDAPVHGVDRVGSLYVVVDENECENTAKDHSEKDLQNILKALCIIISRKSRIFIKIRSIHVATHLRQAVHVHLYA